MFVSLSSPRREEAALSGPEPMTCSQCGNVQAEGEFCERCGGQLPLPVAGAAAGGAPGAATAPAAAFPPPPAAVAYQPPAQYPPAGEYPPQGQYPPPGSYPPAGGQPPYTPVPPGHGFGGSGGYAGPPQGPFGGSRPWDGFFVSLFDLSFHHFVTPKIIKLLFILALVGIGLGMLAMIIAGFSRGIGTGILFVVLAPIAGFIYVLLARLWLEVVVVLFRIEEHTGAMAEQNKK